MRRRALVSTFRATTRKIIMEWLFCRMYHYDNIGKDNSQLGNLIGSERIIKNGNISHTKTFHPNKGKKH